MPPMSVTIQALNVAAFPDVLAWGELALATPLAASMAVTASEAAVTAIFRTEPSIQIWLA